MDRGRQPSIDDLTLKLPFATVLIDLRGFELIDRLAVAMDDQTMQMQRLIGRIVIDRERAHILQPRRIDDRQRPARIGCVRPGHRVDLIVHE